MGHAPGEGEGERKGLRHSGCNTPDGHPAAGRVAVRAADIAGKRYGYTWRVGTSVNGALRPAAGTAAGPPVTSCSPTKEPADPSP